MGGTSPVSAMVVFVNWKPSKKGSTVSTRSRPSSARRLCQHAEVIRRRHPGHAGMAWCHQIWSSSMGGQGQVNIAKQVIQESWGWHSHCRPAEEWHQTHELLFGDPQVIGNFSTSQEFFSSATNPGWSPPFRHHLSPPVAVQEFLLSWMASKAWDQNASSCWWSTLSHWPRSKRSYCGWNCHSRHPTSSGGGGASSNKESRKKQVPWWKWRRILNHTNHKEFIMNHRIAILSDIHGDTTALRQWLRMRVL